MELRPYHLGFWNWCKENHPGIVKEYYQEMQKGMEELEKFVKEHEDKNE